MLSESARSPALSLFSLSPALSSVTFKPFCPEFAPSVLMLALHQSFRRHLFFLCSMALTWWHAMPTGTRRWPMPGKPPARSASMFSSSTAAPMSASSSWRLQTCPGRTITGTTAAGECPPSSEELVRVFADLNYIRSLIFLHSRHSSALWVWQLPFFFPFPFGASLSHPETARLDSARGWEGAKGAAEKAVVSVTALRRWQAGSRSARERVGSLGHGTWHGTVGTAVPGHRLYKCGRKGRRETRAGARGEERSDGNFP